MDRHYLALCILASRIREPKVQQLLIDQLGFEASRFLDFCIIEICMHVYYGYTGTTLRPKKSFKESRINIKQKKEKEESKKER